MSETRQKDGSSTTPREQYTHGYGVLSQVLARRTAEDEGSFFLQYLKSGMNLLDCGCGPGSITLGLAKAVAPAQVIGIDIGQPVLDRARENARQQNVTNIQFQEASVYDLPFPDGSFDATFAHMLMEHLKDPLDAIKEMYRVLKPGGIIGVRSPEFRGLIHDPQNEHFEKAFALYLRLHSHNGGNYYIGGALPRLLREAGFSKVDFAFQARIHALASVNAVAARFLEDDFVEQMEELGWATRDELQTLSDAFKEWGYGPGAYWATTSCAVVGWK